MPRVELSPSAPVRQIADGLVAQGERVWFVAGMVRDSLLGVPSSDWDFATTAPVEVMRRLLPKGHAADEHLGFAGCVIGADDVLFTRLRVESDYGPDRRPRTVEFVDDLQLDAARRDFTINALYVPYPSGELIDPVGGLPDLRSGVLRCIGDAGSRLAEDPLRVLRGARFAARYGLEADAVTLEGLREAAATLGQLTDGRVWSELRDGIDGLGAERFVATCRAFGIDREVFGFERSDVDLELCRQLVESSDPGSAARWLALFAGVPNAAQERLSQIWPVPHGHRQPLAHGLGLLGARRRDVIPEDSLLMAIGDEHWASMRNVLTPKVAVAADERRHRLAQVRALISGQDLLAAGMPSGPEVGRVLGQVREELMQHDVNSRAEALELVRTVLVGIKRFPPPVDRDR